jgi:cellulose synthase/poly-beta-1,6-N-acetylglucosamine synthase-like glycosyltransferase
LISDNASNDATEETVASFNDPRIDYVRSADNVGMIRNLNRIIQLTRSEYLMILPDDDVLYPDYLSSTVPLLELHESVGVAHTGHDRIDTESNVLASFHIATEEPVVFEHRESYLERSMCSTFGTVCWTSALFRTKAIAKAGGLRESEEPFADVPLFLRIALGWDFVSVRRPLVGVRVHEDSETAAAVGSLTDTDYYIANLPQILFERRSQFLDEAQKLGVETERYRLLAQRSFRTQSLHRLANQAGSGRSWLSTASELARLARLSPPILLAPTTWRLIAAQLGGRSTKRLLRRAAHTRRTENELK